MNKKKENVTSIFLSIAGMFIIRSLNAPFLFLVILYILGVINIFQLCQKEIKE